MTILLPAYLLLCLLLGGSQRDIWPNAILQVIGVVLIALPLLRDDLEPLTKASRTLLALILAALVLALVQVVPLPPQLWSSLPGRSPILEAYKLLGEPLPWLPLSMTPYSTLDSLTWCLPPLAVLLSSMRAGTPSASLSVVALLAGAFAGVMLGALQVSDGSGWHLYRITNPGAVGFFANRNFMGTLLLVSIPFTFAFLADRPSRATSAWALRSIGAAGLLVILVGLALNRSMAALILFVPVAIASAALLKGPASFVRYAFPAAALAALAAIAFVTNSPIVSELSGADRSSIESRVWIWDVTLKAIGDSFPAGTGIGSFEPVFATYEDPDLVNNTYVNQAHNDYLEVVLETGLAGLALLIGFLLWWTVQVVRVWRSQVPNGLAKAATIASGAILAHSIVDYPLRTSAIAAVFALCVGLMARSGTGNSGDKSFARPARHIKIA